MLSKTNRLLSDKDFQKIWKRGQSFYTKNLGFKILGNKLSVSRIGIVVGNKVSPLATKRNEIKRRLRAIFRTKMKSLVPGFDLVVLVLPAALGKNFEDLEKEVTAGITHFKLSAKQ